MSGYIGAIPTPQATQSRDVYTATSNQTTFTTQGYTPDLVSVFLNGVHLARADYTATNGSDVVLAVGAAANDTVEIIAFGSFEASSSTFTGDVVASGGTLQATGDTAAGDDAAIGFTSAEGLILTGQGTTSDVTIKNDADATVMSIPTGTTGATFAGTLQLDGAVTLGVAGASNGFINSPSGIFVNIDSDNNQTDRFFDIRKDSTDGSGTLLFQVVETGAVAIPGVLTTTAATVFNGGFAAKGNCTVSPDTAGKDTFSFTSNAANDARLLMRSDTTTKVDIQANGTSFFNGGAVTMPSQPAFLVHPSSSQDNFGADGNLDVVAFGTERFDQGANFGSNVFTAPVAGKYHFDVKIFLVNLDAAAAYYSVRLVTSNRSYDFEFDPDFGQDAGRWTASFSVLADMAATHTAGVQVLQVQGTSQTDIATQSYFSGHLAV